MSNTLSQILEQHAEELCKLLNKPFKSFGMGKGFGTVIDHMDVRFSVPEKVGVILLSSYKDDMLVYSSVLHVHEDGSIQYYLHAADSHRAERSLIKINTLPIIDFLREKGFEFKY